MGARHTATPTARAPAAQRLNGARVDPGSGLHIGTLQIGDQRLRVGIRPHAALNAALASPPTPLLVFNGIGANLELIAPLLAALRDVETIIFDVPGAGQSPPPRWPYRLWSMARLSARLMATLGYNRADVLGVSWGGGLAQQFAIQYPGRVRRLVLAATSMGGITMWPGHPRVLWKMVSPRRYADKDYLRREAPELYGGAARTSAEAIEWFARHARGGHPRGYRYQLLAALGWTSLPWLWRIGHPTLLLAGRDDPLIPLVNARLQSWLMRNARLHVIDDGHLFVINRAHEVALLMQEFLEASDRAPARSGA